MSIIVPDGWPDGFRRHGLVACDGAHSDADRRAALGKLGNGLDVAEIGSQLSHEILSFFTSLVADGAQPSAIRVEVLRVLRESLDREALVQSLRNEILSFCACLIARGAGPIADEAATVLRPTIQMQARRASRSRKQACLDLVAESEGIIVQRLREGKYRTGKVFVPWCFRVLRNESIDRFRRLQTDALGHGGPQASEPAYVESETAVDQNDLLTAPFSPADMTKIEEMNEAANRLIALCEPQLWRKVADNDPTKWGLWVARSGGTLPFPPSGFVGLATQNLRAECLAKALGLTTDAVKKRWFRDCLPVLRQLEFSRRLGS